MLHEDAWVSLWVLMRLTSTSDCTNSDFQGRKRKGDGKAEVGMRKENGQGKAEYIRRLLSSQGHI
jgi:hypothetical protein